MEVSASEFARMAGVKPSSIAEKINNGTLIRNSGKKLDTDNPVNRAYLDKKQSKNQANNLFAAAGTATRIAKIQPPAAPATDEFERINNDLLQLEMLIEMLKNDSKLTFEKLEKAVKLTTIIIKNRSENIKNQERRAKLIPTSFVSKTIFGLMKILIDKLFDMIENQLEQIYAINKSSEDEENGKQKIRALLKNYISKAISDTKHNVQNSLDDFGKASEESDDKKEEFVEAIQKLQEAQNEE